MTTLFHLDNDRRRQRRAMTLLELATTVASISSLVLILLPGLAEARRQGKEIHCLANLGRIADASAAYANADRREFAVPVHPLSISGPGSRGEYEWGGKSGTGEPLAGTDALSSRWGTIEGLGPATRPLNRILYGDRFPDHQFDSGPFGGNWLDDTKLDLDVYRCPADYGYSGHHYLSWRDSKLSSYDHYGNSYSASTAWIGVPGASCRLASNSSFMKPVSRIPVTARTVMYMENCGRFGYRANYGLDGCGSLFGQFGADVETNVRGWHGQMWMIQVAFVDGHVGRVRMEGHRKPAPDFGRYPPYGGSPTSYNFWSCVIFRGPGWQLDTLPSPPVQTEIPCGIGGVFSNPIG